jgi:hypothetical protein
MEKASSRPQTDFQVAKAIVVRKSSGPKGRAGSSPALGIPLALIIT